MNDIVLLVVRVLAGGTLVVAFAMISDAVKPKMFSGLFSGAPSVATASLLVTVSPWVRRRPTSTASA